MREVSARAVRARAAAPPRGDRRSNYDVVQRHRQTTLGCASLTAVVFFIRVTTERRRGCGVWRAIRSARAARQLEARAAGATARAAACVAVRRAVACDRGAHIVDVCSSKSTGREVALAPSHVRLRRAALPTAASPDLEDAKPPPPPRPRRRRLRPCARLAALAVVVGADDSSSRRSHGRPRANRRDAGAPVHGDDTTSRLVAATPSLHSPLAHALAERVRARARRAARTRRFSHKTNSRSGTRARPAGSCAKSSRTPTAAPPRSSGFASPAATARSRPTRRRSPIVRRCCSCCTPSWPAITTSRWRVVLHARRGHGDLPFTTPRWNTVGNTSDARDALRAVRARHPAAAALCIAGFSAGSGLMMRFLGEPGDAGPQLARAAVGLARLRAAGCVGARPLAVQRAARQKVRVALSRDHREAYAAPPSTRDRGGRRRARLARATPRASARRLRAPPRCTPQATPSRSRPPSACRLLLNALDDPFCVIAERRRPPRPGAREPEPRAGDDAARRTLGLLRGADGEAVGGARRARVARRRARGRAGSGLCTS